MSASKKPLTFDMDIGPKVAAAPAVLKEDRIQVGTRVTVGTYRQLKARAALTGEKLQNLVELAITEFLTNHPDQ